MNICKVDLLKLKNILENGDILDQNEIDIINRIIFIADSKKITDANIIIVYGNPNSLFDRCDTGIDIWNKNEDAVLLLSGGAFLPNKKETESEAMRQYCISRGVPSEKVVIENNSLTTGENVEYCAAVVKAINPTSPSITSISSKTHLRRIMMNFKKHRLLYPERCEFYYANSNEQNFGPDTWLNDQTARKAIATELGFIHEYLYELNYPFFDF